MPSDSTQETNDRTGVSAVAGAQHPAENTARMEGVASEVRAGMHDGTSDQDSAKGDVAVSSAHSAAGGRAPQEPPLAFLSDRWRFYADGCQGIEDRARYFSCEGPDEQNIASDAAQDLDLAIEWIRTLLKRLEAREAHAAPPLDWQETLDRLARDRWKQYHADGYTNLGDAVQCFAAELLKALRADPAAVPHPQKENME